MYMGHALCPPAPTCTTTASMRVGARGEAAKAKVAEYQVGTQADTAPG